ncbi:recombinase family protein [Flavobacterium sp. MC2016-06]|jgi:DNA invertase Pin-like site-specific DNA recombinase|uniref:recombinase family protein n=1 Tax=Flavobacterium sp. MC2016-06 TaxID=2676308 RepID=UPI0012BA829B|nr:recombinase family protein [Flavobacterium sp. MC2016-06]MBU3861019.1 recombinase family protein [Flavobacterium sp. MC2016-06]
MTAKYIRISDKSQKVDRQLNDKDKLYIDIISGKTPFNERPQAKQLMQDVEQGLIKQTTVQDVSRLGRNLIDTLQTLEYMHDKGVCVYVHNIGMYSMIDGKESPAFKMVVTILANIAEQELSTLKERQAEGIKAAQAKGTYKGRLLGSSMSPDELTAKHPDIVKLLKGKAKVSYRNIAKITSKNLSTVQRVSDAYKTINAPFYYNADIDPFAPSKSVPLQR